MVGHDTMNSPKIILYSVHGFLSRTVMWPEFCGPWWSHLMGSLEEFANPLKRRLGNIRFLEFLLFNREEKLRKFVLFAKIGSFAFDNRRVDILHSQFLIFLLQVV